MKLVATLKLVLSHLTVAIALSPLMIACVIAAEGAQHIVEWHLGMYESRKMFAAHQSDTIRLGFGAVKAVSVIAACYFIPKKLFKAYGPAPRHGSFNNDMLRKLWDPRADMSGLMAMLILAAPLIFLHFRLSELAMGHSFAPILLILDSFLIGLLAATMGLSIWAGDFAGQDEAQPMSEAAGL